jgi:antitoxin component YwqK of YwqJK toxin-antitoxin module
MRKFFTIAILALSINAYSQKLVKEYYDWAKTKIKREYYTDAYGTLNGSYKAYSEYGGIMKQGQCKDDGPIGKWIENYDNGKLHYIKIYDTPGTYDFQVKDGKIISYYEDGKTIKYERNFKNMELDGVWKEYDEKGIITKEGKYVNGVFEPTGITKIKYDEEQALILLKNTEEYKKIIPEADKAFIAKDFNKALELYKSASELMVNEKHPKDKISEILETYHTNSKFFIEYIKSQYDSIVADFNEIKQNFKIREIKQYDEYSQTPRIKEPLEAKFYTYGNEYTYCTDCFSFDNFYKCDCKEPWNEHNPTVGLKCFELNKNYYEPYQIIITESFLKFNKALDDEEKNVKNSKTSFTFNNVNNTFYAYDKDKFISNIKMAKQNYVKAKTIIPIALNFEQNIKQIEKLNIENKKKILFPKYSLVLADFQAKYNAYPSLEECITILNEANSFLAKVISLYSTDTKDLEKQLKSAETIEQIKSIILK